MTVPHEVKEYRRKQCESCPFFVKETQSCGTFLPKKMAKLQGVRGDLVELEGRKRKVRLCGCFMPAKWPWPWFSCSLPAEHSRWGSTVTKEDIKEIKKLLADKQNTKEWYDQFIEKYESAFQKNARKNPSCGSCNQVLINELQQLVDKYESE